MAIQTVLILVENRIISTKEILGKDAPALISLTIEEVRAITGFEGKKDSELSALQKIYIADLVAVRVFTYALDRYMQDAKAKEGPDGLVHEAQDKLKYLKEQIKRFEESANKLAGKLGIGIVSVPPLVVKIEAAAETNE